MNLSQDLLDVDAAVTRLREQAKTAQAAHHDQVAKVERSTQLSDEGKRETLADITTEHRTRMNALLAQEKQIISTKIEELEKRLDAQRTPEEIIAYRDAQDRVEAVQEATRATELMTRALRSQDKTLALALFRAAIENGWTTAANLFREKNPSTATVISDIAQLMDLQHSFSRAIAYM